MPEYGTELKRIVFADTDKRHADLKIRLRYDGLTQMQFFQSIITGYIESDPRIVEYFMDIKKEISKQGKAKINKSNILLKQADTNKKLYRLSKEESDEIFDLIAEEFDDL